MDDKSTSSQVARILYKEIVPGDLRKLEARSNDADTGGGARDFRFGSFDQVLPIVKHMFPNLVTESRRRGGQNVQIEVHSGSFYWKMSSGAVKHKQSFFEPPTDVRPSEGRIPRVHEYPCFDVSLIPSGGEGNRVLVLLIQLKNGTVWPYYAEERTLRTPGAWNAKVAKELLSCIDAQRREGQSVIGFKDFVNNTSYCNAK